MKIYINRYMLHSYCISSNLYLFIELQLHLHRIEESRETILQCPHPVHLQTLMQLQAALVQRCLDCTTLPRLVGMASYRVSDSITRLLYSISRPL